MQDVVIATPVKVRALRPARTLDERLMVRFPGAYRALAAVGLGLLSPRSRLRRTLLRRTAVSGWSAWAREDLDLLLVRYATDCRLDPPPEYVGAGLDSSGGGHASYRAMAADLRDAWEQMDITPLEILDAGDRIVILGRVHIRARASGVEWDSELGVAYWLASGLVVRECPRFAWDEALGAVGITRSR